MKTILLLISSLLLLKNCNNKEMRLQDKFPFPISNCYFQHWIAGIEGGGSGINFIIEFKEALPTDCILQFIYFRNKKSDLIKVEANLYQANFKGDANFKEEINKDTKENTNELNKITDLYQLGENDAVLVYYYKKKLYYYKMVAVKEKEILAYPTINNRN